MTDTEQDLVRRASSGDTLAAEALWRANRRFVAACLLATAPRSVELADLLQEVAMQMWTGIRSLREPGRLRPWLRSIALNAARSGARKAAVRGRLVRPLDEVDAELPDRSEPGVADELRSQVGEAMAILACLPEEYREPLLLRAVDGLTQRQIAEALDLPETTVETRLARARQMLRRRVADQQEQTGRPPATETAIRGARR